MIRLNEEKLKSLYPDMTEAFSARMESLIRSLPARKEASKMKRKLSVGLVLAVALILATAAAAVAASLGVFAQLAQAHDPDERLEDLDTLATPVQQTLTTDDGVTVTIDQAYYDGERVFISYRLTGGLISVETGLGPLENVDWFDPGGEEYEIGVDPDDPAAAVIETLRAGKTNDWARLTQAQLHDGLRLADGAYLDIIGGETRLLPDGTVLGWKECEVPGDRAAETLACKAVLFRTVTTYQKTEKGLRAAFARTGGQTETDVPFAVRMEKGVTRLTGSAAVPGLYAARADGTLNGVDFRVMVTLECPKAWVKAWMDWNERRDFDMIEAWALYSDGERIGTGSDRGVTGEGNLLTYEAIIRHGGHTENLRLVPVYADSGEHPEEGIELKTGTD